MRVYGSKVAPLTSPACGTLISSRDQFPRASRQVRPHAPLAPGASPLSLAARAPRNAACPLVFALASLLAAPWRDFWRKARVHGPGAGMVGTHTGTGWRRATRLAWTRRRAWERRRWRGRCAGRAAITARRLQDALYCGEAEHGHGAGSLRAYVALLGLWTAGVQRRARRSNLAAF